MRNLLTASRCPARRWQAPLRVRLLCIGAAVAIAGCGGEPTTPRPAPPATPPATPPPPPATPSVEARALWVNRFEYTSEESIRTILQKAADANFNVIYFQVRGNSDALYRSRLEPCGIALCGKLGGTPTWDPLEVAVREAHSRGMQLHAWLNAMTGWAASSASVCGLLRESDAGNPRHILLEHPEWAVVDQANAAHGCPNGEEYIYLSPGNPGVRTHLARVAADIARRYAIDGIHLDRIRYPGTRWSYDSASVRAFGKDPRDGVNAAAWTQFRRDLINLTVKETHDSLRVARPAAVLSAAVWGIYDDKWGWNSSRGVSQYFQDPRAWARDGYLDVAVPMTYYNINATPCGFADWACLLDDHLQGVQAATGRHVYIGIAANIPANKGSAEVIRQIELARTKGAKGIALYSYASADKMNLWTELAGGVFKQKATIPPMSWR